MLDKMAARINVGKIPDFKNRETLMIQATEYEAETNGGTGQGLMYFYICDGEILDGKSEPRKELNQTFELTAEKSGEYYICLLGVSSDPISLKEGKIVIK